MIANYSRHMRTYGLSQNINLPFQNHLLMQRPLSRYILDLATFGGQEVLMYCFSFNEAYDGQYDDDYYLRFFLFIQYSHAASLIVAGLGEQGLKEEEGNLHSLKGTRSHKLRQPRD